MQSLRRVNKVTVCNQSGAERATTRIGTGSLPAVRFTAIVSKLTSSFFYQALPHLILYSLFRVDKMFGLQSERNGVSDNANRERQLAAGGVSDNANRLRRHSAANWERQLAGTNWRHSRKSIFKKEKV